MKQLITIGLVALTLAACNTDQQTPPGIEGRWETQFADGTDVLAVFRADGSLDFFVDNKLFVSGNYSFANDTLRASDPFCGADNYASYKIDFVTPDSVHFHAVQDSCPPRKRDLDGAAYRRVKL